MGYRQLQTRDRNQSDQTLFSIFAAMKRARKRFPQKEMFEVRVPYDTAKNKQF